jgi:hypothetical protein
VQNFAPKKNAVPNLLKQEDNFQILSPEFYFFKTLATNYKKRKTERRFLYIENRLKGTTHGFCSFFKGRVSPHLCPLAKLLRVP